MKKFLTLLVFLIPFLLAYAQNKPIQKKKTLDILLTEKVNFDLKDGKIIPEKELDDVILNYSLGTKILNHLNNNINEEDSKKAMDYLNKAIDNGYTGALVYAERGICEYFLELYSKAIVDFSKALELNSDIGDDVFRENEHYDITDSGYVYRSANSFIFWLRPSMAFNIRGASKMELQDYRGAISDFSESFQYNSQKGNSQLLFSMGVCKFQLKNYSGAKIDFNKVIAINATNAKAYYYRGGCNYNLDLKESACKDWSKAGELGFEQAYKDIQEYCN